MGVDGLKGPFDLVEEEEVSIYVDNSKIQRIS
jgi:hypothetical protein